MKKKVKHSLIVLYVALSVITISISVSAHSPSSMTLLYDFNTQTLDVTVFHTVADPGTHYIEDIIIWVNDILNQSQGYSSQDSVSQHHDTFVVPTVHGDEIKVQAICSISGSVTETIIVQNPSVPELGVILPLLLFTSFASVLGFLFVKKKRE